MIEGKFPIGAAVWFYAYSGERYAAIVTGNGSKNGNLVVDLDLVEVADRLDRSIWAYVEQVELRQGIVGAANGGFNEP
jgi:hypothetical protein